MGDSNAPRAHQDSPEPVRDEPEQTQIVAKEFEGCGLIPRLVFLAFLLTALELWWWRHVGGSVWSFFLVALAVPIGAFIGGIYSVIVGKEPWRQFLRICALVLVGCRMLTLLTIILLLGGGMLSSVRLDVGTVGEQVRVHMRSNVFPREASRTLKPDSTRLLVSWLPTLPWGSEYVVQIAGFYDGSFRLRPGLGSTIDLSTLEVMPSVVVRVPLSNFPDLVGGRVELWSADGAKMISSIETQETRGSVMFGYARPVPDPLEKTWKTHLQGLLQEAQASSALSRWTLPLMENGASELHQSMKLTALFKVNETILSCAEFVVGGDKIMDVPLTRGTTSCESFSE